MPFFSFSFLILFVLCFVIYYNLKEKYRNTLLLLSSLVFIGWYNLSFLLLALGATFFTFFWAKWIERRAQKKKSTKTIFIVGIAVLIAAWLSFHYTAALLSVVVALVPFVHLHDANSFIFPLGMSFYTFQAIGYLTDVYWQEERAEQNPIDFSLYMLFFMKFLSGPIERPGAMLEQLKHPKPFSYSMVVYGLKLILLGLFKKLLIANYLAPQTDAMFSNIHEVSGIQLLMTCLLYPIQLYADFSGYTDIAIGGAMMFGIKLSPNFNRPFSAKSTSELWRRWHISLSSWVRDYIYVPLTAATRGWGQRGVFFSLIVTFVLLGVWHGAGWTFAIYGLIQGVIICWEMKFTLVRSTLKRYVGEPVTNAIFIVRTYLLFALSLIFFRLSSISDALYFIRNISFKVHSSWTEMNIDLSDRSLNIIGGALLLILLYEHFTAKSDLITKIDRQPIWVRWSIYYVLTFAVLLFGNFETANFIYLQF